MLGFAALFALAACATPQPRPAQATLPTLRLPPAALGASVALQQRLTVSRDGRQQHADALLEVDAQMLRLVLLVGPRRLLTLQFDGQALHQQRDPSLPEALSGERFVDDIVLAYWPLSALRAALPADWTLHDAARSRTLSQHGSAKVRISYSEATRWLGHIVIDHYDPGYRLSIDSVGAAP